MRLIIFLLLLSRLSFAQTVLKVLVVPLADANIVFEQTNKKVLQRNRVPEDSARKLICAYADLRLGSALTGCEIVISFQFPELNFLKDSIATFGQFTTFYYQGITKRSGLKMLFCLPIKTFGNFILEGCQLIKR